DRCGECVSFPHALRVRIPRERSLFGDASGVFGLVSGRRRKTLCTCRTTFGVSTMSDLDRNYASPFGRAATRADAATVDAGLRAYMLRICNYMAIGLAITGLAALGVYMFAVTGDA